MKTFVFLIFIMSFNTFALETNIEQPCSFETVRNEDSESYLLKANDFEMTVILHDNLDLFEFENHCSTKTIIPSDDRFIAKCDSFNTFERKLTAELIVSQEGLLSEITFKSEVKTLTGWKAESDLTCLSF